MEVIGTTERPIRLRRGDEHAVWRDIRRDKGTVGQLSQVFRGRGVGVVGGGLVGGGGGGGGQ